MLRELLGHITANQWRASQILLINAEIAKTVFGWEDVNSHEGQLIGKKPDKLGRMRTAKVPNYAGDATLASAIDERIKQLGKDAVYEGSGSPD